MHFAHLGAAAAMTATTQAFLIPFTMSIPNIKDVALASANERVVEVKCHGCPIQTSGDGLMNWGNAESMLRLNFTVLKGDTLMVNNVQVYPFKMERISTTLTAEQLIKTPDDTWAYSSTTGLGYGLKMIQSTKEGKEAEDEMSLLAFSLDIIEVGSKFVRGIPSISVTVVDKNGKLMIADAHTEKARGFMTGSLLQSGENMDCTTLLCKWKAIVTAKAAALKKGCGGMAKSGMHGFPRPHGIKGGPNKFGHHSRPHGQFDQGHRHQSHGTIARLLRSFTFHIVIPILIGVIVGITASLVGMVVGQLVVLVWRVLFRRGQRGQYNRVEQETDDVDEKTEIFIIEDQPPVYQDAVVVIDEKTEQK